MSARTKARKRALDILFGADVRAEPIPTALESEVARVAAQQQRISSWDYARQIVEGIIEHGAEIDELIVTYAHGWKIERMPAVDRALLRIGTWELAHNPEVPASVAISEAVEAAQLLSTDDSAGFVNGVLGRIATAVRPA